MLYFSVKKGIILSRRDLNSVSSPTDKTTKEMFSSHFHIFNILSKDKKKKKGGKFWREKDKYRYGNFHGLCFLTKLFPPRSDMKSKCDPPSSDFSGQWTLKLSLFVFITPDEHTVSSVPFSERDEGFLVRRVINSRLKTWAMVLNKNRVGATVLSYRQWGWEKQMCTSSR
jgi:hypothetical protein